MPLQLPSSDPQPLSPGLYGTDAFHRRPLFAINGHVVASWNEAHALHGPAELEDINPAYVAALISGECDAQASPYRLIYRLPRAHHVRVGSDGVVQTHRYDPLAGGAAAMEQGDLHQFLRQGLIDHLQRTLEGHAGAIGCEHSSGLDSNAVLGGLVHGVGVDPERIHTWSREEGGEGSLLQTFRPFYQLKTDQCHSRELNDIDCEPCLDFNQKQLEMFGAPLQLGGNTQSLAVMIQNGCTVVFSGFGGDQAISHNAANVPTDLVAQGRWHELRQWMGGTRATLKTAASRALALSCRPWATNKVLRLTRNIYSGELLKRTLTPEGRQWLGPHLNAKKFPWEFDNYVKQHLSIRRRTLADWLAVRVEDEIRLAAFYGLEKAFPLLDEKLIGALLQQDPVLFGERAGSGRLLHRRAFAPFLPPILRNNPTKMRLSMDDIEHWHAELIKKLIKALELKKLSEIKLHPNIFSWWNVEDIFHEIENVLSNPEPTLSTARGATNAITTIESLSCWWQALDS